jgi:twitching motility protein PilT
MLLVHMARIDRILAIVLEQGANELRVGTDREPVMLAYGARKKLSLPKTPDDMLRDLLGDLLSPENESALRASGRLEIDYDAGELGHFRTTLVARDGGIDATFVRAMAPKRASEARPAAPAHVPAPPPPSVPSAPAAVEHVAGSASAAFEALVSRAASLRASDIHLAQHEPPTARVDGRLEMLDGNPIDDVGSLLGLSSDALSHLGRGHAIDLAIQSLRVHVYPTSEGLAAAIRLLPPNAPTLGSLRLPMPLASLVEFPHGLVLVCGAAGSGKSTTLAALAQHALEKRSILLVTLEDPIEYRLAPGERSIVRRRQIGRDVPDFATGLREALREDLDVLLVGELRDAATIQLAMTAAETGHLVLASIHSRSTASAIARIIDAYPGEQQEQARSQLADSLRAVVAQRLLPRARGGGRVVAMELLRATPAVSALVREGKQAQLATAMQSGKGEGMLVLERSLAALVEAGEVDAAEARAAANDASSLAMYLGRSS